MNRELRFPQEESRILAFSKKAGLISIYYCYHYRAYLLFAVIRHIGFCIGSSLLSLSFLHFLRSIPGSAAWPKRGARKASFCP